jgi:hypothetical protein
MLSVGSDLHKKYSQLEVIDEAGVRRAGARLPNELDQVAGFFRSLGEPCRVVLEAGWNWGSMYDWLKGIEWKCSSHTVCRVAGRGRPGHRCVPKMVPGVLQ